MVGLVPRASILLFACLVLASIGCASVPSFPAPPHDGGVQCTMAIPCPTGQACLQGVCYATCDAMHACGPREMCMSGMCVARTSDAGPIPHDAGNDAGRCAILMCATMTPATPVCAYDQCLQCQATSDCGGATPICDIGRGNCTQFAAQYCAPCNGDLDCAGTPTPSHCVMRNAPDAIEHVCLPTPTGGGTCPGGFMAAGTNCVPIYFSCTAIRAAQQHRPCTMDSDCPQLGATPSTGLFTGMCAMDAAAGRRICHVSCMSSDCPAGLTCSPAAGFCQ